MESARCRAFLAAADMGSLSKAAEALDYTPSGVSQLVGALEKELGFLLLYRSSKGVCLTENGEKLLPAVREFILQEERIRQLASEVNGLLSGSVTVASYSSIATHWLPGIIRIFQGRYPNIRIKLMEGVRQEVTAWLDEKTADIAFLSYKEPMDYDWIPLAEDPMFAVLPKDHPCSGNEAYPIERCAGEKFIMPALGRDDDVTELLRRNGVMPDIRFSTLDNFAAISMIEQGLGMCIMNELITNGWQSDVAKIPLEPPQKITLGIAMRSLKNASPAARRFVKCAAENLTRQEI